MKIATQDDLDKFYSYAITDINIYPYLTTNQFFRRCEIPKDDWSDIFMVSEDLKCFLKIQIDRTRGIEFSIALYALSSYHAGKAILAIKEIVKRYKPRAINSVVHSSNSKSLKLHKRFFGEPWGTEKLIAWNMGKGEFEDLHYFRLML